MILHHITLHTGQTTTHRIDTLDPRAVAACAALLPSGGQVPAFPAFRVEIATPELFTICRGREPLATCCLGDAGSRNNWDALVALQQKFLPVSATMPRGRWLAVLLLPAIAALAPSDLGWLADFERCLAAALIQNQTAQ